MRTPQFPNRQSAIGNRQSPCRAFTLVEMVVVVAIIIVLVTLVLPAASTLWAQRKAAQAENMLQGLLRTARADALRADAVETGFFAFVDEQGGQHLVPIEQMHTNAAVLQRDACLPEDEQNGNGLREKLNDPRRQTLANVFVIRDEPDRILPAPMRVVPLGVVEGQTNTRPYLAFGAEELANNDFRDPPGDKTQRHRNFFTVVFGTDGELRINRDVLIFDCNSNADEGDDRGDRTALTVADATGYYRRDGQDTPIDPITPEENVPNLIADDDGVAVNFPSVAGLLVYDDQLFSELPGGSAAELEAKRDFLLREGQPLYITRYTATVLRGPKQEVANDE